MIQRCGYQSVFITDFSCTLMSEDQTSVGLGPAMSARTVTRFTNGQTDLAIRPVTPFTELLMRSRLGRSRQVCRSTISVTIPQNAISNQSVLTVDAAIRVTYAKQPLVRTPYVADLGQRTNADTMVSRTASVGIRSQDTTSSSLRGAQGPVVCAKTSRSIDTRLRSEQNGRGN